MMAIFEFFLIVSMTWAMVLLVFGLNITRKLRKQLHNSTDS